MRRICARKNGHGVLRNFIFVRTVESELFLFLYLELYFIKKYKVRPEIERQNFMRHYLHHLNINYIDVKCIEVARDEIQSRNFLILRSHIRVLLSDLQLSFFGRFVSLFVSCLDD